MRATGTLAITAIVGLLLVGCSPQSEPTPTGDDPADQPQGTPTIVWENGEPSGGLEDDPYVQAARAEDTGYLMAVNAQDFSIPEFTSTHTAEDAQEFYEFHIEEFVDGGGMPVAFAGPSILLPLEVHENEAGDGADVLFCDASVDWAMTSEFPEPAYDLESGETLTITIITDPETGNLVFGGEDRTGESCDATGAPVGRFDPQPTIRDSISLDDVTAP